MNKHVKRIIIIGLLVNIILTSLKLVGGYLGNTTSLVSDGYNSLTDIVISLLLFITINIASKKADKDHPYGHEKYEGIISFLLGLILLVTAGYILVEGIINITSYSSNVNYEKPKIYTLYIAFISIGLKFILFYINKVGSKKYNQVSLKAESYNHLSDIFATTASLVGIIFALYGFIIIDYIAAVIISLIIFKNGFSVTKEAISFLVDEAPSKPYVQSVKKEVLSVSGVIQIDDLKSRKHVNKVYIDIEISVDRNLSLIEAHNIAENVHQHIESTFKDVIHCMVHVNPKSNKNIDE